MCTHLGELCVYFAVSAEYAMRAHVTVLAWDGRSYFGTIYTKAETYIHEHMHGHQLRDFQARLCSCSRSNMSVAFLYFIRPMYWR
jgi:hypothetical protein